MPESLESIANTANLAPGSARNPTPAGGSDLRVLAQVENWMTIIREINSEQQEVRFDVQTPGETVANNVAAKLGSPYEIKIDERDRVLNSAASGGGYTCYVALIVGLLVTTCGVAWFILYGSALPFAVTLASGLPGNRDLKAKAISLGIAQSSKSPTAQAPDAQQSDRIQIHDTMVREIARNVPAEAPQNPGVSAAPTKSVSSAPLSQLASKDSIVATGRTGSTDATVNEARAPTKLTPTPETRPTTIEGWTLRAVVNGTAVIEGPNGVWTVTPGQTVPGVGRVDSIVRWGNRFIVATSRGLISTP
jgi:hypothetical protein